MKRLTTTAGALLLAAGLLTLANPAPASALPPAVDRAHRILIFGDVLGEHDYTENPMVGVDAALRSRGYQVDDRTRNAPLPVNLSVYGQVWHFDADPEFSRGMSPQTVNALIAYSHTGGGILLTAGGRTSPSAAAVVNRIMASPITLDDVVGTTPEYLNPAVVPHTLLTTPCNRPVWTEGNGRILGLTPITNVLARTVKNSVRAASWQSNAARNHGPVILLMDPPAAAYMSFRGGMCAGLNFAHFLTSGLPAGLGANTVTPGAFCRTSGATGWYRGLLYTCRGPLPLRWRR